ncbi:MAG TPA: hypothetical protein VID73_12315 [Ktedonobacterales bacterium]
MPDDVAVTTDQARYAPAATLGVTITNHGAAAIRVADHQSDCTAVRIEGWDGQAWQLRHPCHSMRPTRLHTIAPGAALAQPLRPPADGATDGASGWPPGTYRATCAYLVGADGAEAMAHSAPFTIG